MLLSSSLNNALQKRKEYLDPLKAFKYFNSDQKFFEEPKKKEKEKQKLHDDDDDDSDCSFHKRGDKNSSVECKDDAASDLTESNPRILPEHEFCLKKCECQCSPNGKPLELSNIHYKDCLDLVDVDVQGGEWRGTWRKYAIQEKWSNLHEAAHFVFVELVGDFQKLREDANKHELEADYSQYNDYHAIDMFAIDPGANKGNPLENRLFLLYSLVYCTLNPNQDRGEFLENFESYQNYMEYLRDVNFADFVAIVPLLRVFFTVHDEELSVGSPLYWKSRKGKGVSEDFSKKTNPSSFRSEDSKKKYVRELEISDIKNDLENLAEFFLRRSFLEQAYDTGYNVYTAVNVYYLSFDLHKSFKRFYEDTKELKSSNQREVMSCEDCSSSTVKANSKGKNSAWQYITHTELWHFTRNTWLFELFFGYEINEEEAKQRLLKSCFEEAKLRGELQSSIERAAVCFVFQFLLYFGCFLLSTSQECYEDGGLLNRKMKDLVCCVAMYFCYQYLTAMAISEFYINSLTLFESGRFTQKVLICLNVLINTFFSLSLVYSGALVMKSSGSFTDAILNAIAIFFISELDDMLVTDLDEEALEERTVQALIGIMVELSMKHNPGITHRLEEEQYIIKFVGWYSFLFLLPYSYFTYFRFQDTVSDLDCD